MNSPFSYNFGGLHLHAPWALPGVLPEAAAAPDLRVELAAGPAPRGQLLYSWPGRYGLQLAALGEQFLFHSARDGAFLISPDAALVTCFAPPGSAVGDAPDGMLQLLTRRVLPRVAQLHGRTALHGASIMLDQHSAMLVLGPSGAGKSTLAAALQRDCGMAVLSDDISLVDAAARPARCFSVVHGACLWPDSLAALASDDMVTHALASHDQKRWRELTRAPVPRMAQLRAVVMLAPDDGAAHAPRLQRLASAPALVAAMRQQIRFNPLDLAPQQATMASLARLLQATPAYALSYPRAYAALPAVAHYVHTSLTLPCSEEIA
ncbi:MAG: hypothetical protein V4484_20110 [Pseudomonadota bacterium]